MKKFDYYSSGRLDHSTDELRELILKNPDLPMLVFAGEECNNGEWSYMCCTTVRAEIGEYLDTKNEVSDEILFTDRDEFREEMEDKYYGEEGGTGVEFDKFIDEKIAAYEQFWKPVILVYVDN